MSEKHDCERFYKDLYTENSLFAQNSDCYNVKSKITVYFMILNQCDIHFKDQAATKHCFLFLDK